MKQEDDYIDGPHHYWINFWCGLVFVAVVITRIGWQNFDTGWPVIVTATVLASASA